MADLIAHPSHYTIGIETRIYIKSWDMSYAEGNVIKYVTRAPHKGQKLRDLLKAKQYLEWLIEYAADEESEARDLLRETEYGKGRKNTE